MPRSEEGQEPTKPEQGRPSTKPAGAKPEGRGGPPEGKSRWGFAVTLALVMAAIASVVVVQVRSSRRELQAERPPWDSQQMLQVVHAVSGVILARGDEAEAETLRALEALHPSDLAAGDLRDACFATYGGMHELHGLVREQRALLARADAGTDSGAAELPPEVLSRVVALNQRAEVIVRQVEDSKNRCISLYEAAALRLGVQPARRRRAE